MRGHYTCPVLIWVPDFYIGNYLRAARGRERVSDLRRPAAARCERVRNVLTPSVLCRFMLVSGVSDQAPDESEVFDVVLKNIVSPQGPFGRYSCCLIIFLGAV